MKGAGEHTKSRDDGGKAGMDQLFQRLAAAQDAALARPARAVAAPGRRTRPWVLVAAGAGAMMAAAAIAVFVVSFVRPGGPETAAVTPGTVVAPELFAPAVAPLEAPARETLAAGDSELPLHFADGSIATFRPGSTGRLLARNAHGAEVELLEGRLEAQIVHAQRTRWVFRAGPFAVHVTGTRFDVDWSPRTRRLVVSLREGSVTVDGAVLGAGVPLRAGQRLSVALDARGEAAVRTEAMAPAPSLAGKRVAHAPTRDWLALAERGAHGEAWRLAQTSGLAELRRRLPAPQLLALADVARYAGARNDARDIYTGLVARFPGHPLAGDAVFSLGRLAFESNDVAGAARWFTRYREMWPDGALAGEAIGRLLESSAAIGDSSTARGAARAYLDRTPEGPYAPLARRMLGGGK